MPKATTKADLIKAANDNFNKMWAMIDSMSAEEQEADFCFDVKKMDDALHWKRDKNLRDVLVHLYEWHQLLIEWEKANTSGSPKPFLPVPYTWKTYGEMNIKLWEKHQELNWSLAKAAHELRASHNEAIAVISKYTDEQLFTKALLKWTGTTSLGQYCHSATVAHYDWAMEKAKRTNKGVKRINMPSRIETKRLLLRPLTLDDAESAFCGWTGDAEAMEFVSWLPHTDISQTIEWLKEVAWKYDDDGSVAKNDNYIWGFELKETGKLIGSGGLIWEDNWQVFEVGYNINKDYWGKGFTTEAMRAIIEFASSKLKIKRLMGVHAKVNIGSQRVLEKLGFIYHHDSQTPHIDGKRIFDSREYMLDLDDSKISFRKIADADLPLLESWLKSDHVKKWFEVDGVCTIEDWLHEIKNRDGEFSWLHHLIFELGGKPLGFGVYYDCFDAQEEWYEVKTKGEVFSIDYFIGEASFLCKGHGKEIIRLLLEQINKIATVKKIIVQPDNANANSCGVLMANGFRYDELTKYFIKTL